MIENHFTGKFTDFTILIFLKKYDLPNKRCKKAYSRKVMPFFLYREVLRRNNQELPGLGGDN